MIGKKIYFLIFLLILIVINLQGVVFAGNANIQHTGRIAIQVIDTSGTAQDLEEIFVSCAEGETNVTCDGDNKITITIKTTKKCLINCQLSGSKRWLADVWHHEFQGENLILNKYRLKVNGHVIGASSVVKHGDHANFQINLY